MNIGIVILATNGYFPLGIRLIKRFNQFYKGESEITYYLFSDKNPKPYLPDNIDCKWSFMENKNWVDGTNMKFKSILSLTEIVVNTECWVQFPKFQKWNTGATEVFLK